MKRRYMRDRKTITKRGGKRERIECTSRRKRTRKLDRKEINRWRTTLEWVTRKKMRGKGRTKIKKNENARR